MVTKGYTSPIAIHPSETISELLNMLEISQADLSIRTKLSERTISEIVNGKQSITLETALKLERALGISKEGLIKMQNEYDSDLLRIKELERLQKETKHLEKFRFCYPELSKFGYVPQTRDKIDKVDKLLRFFAVNALSSIEDSIPVAFRKSKKAKTDSHSLAAWLRIGKIKANNRQVKPFSDKKLKENITKMRSLTIQKPEVFSKELIDLCNDSGIVLVYTPHINKAPVNGATCWLSPEKVLIQTSLRYKSADIFWFTFFHEIGHVLKHSKKKAFVEFSYNSMDKSEQEREADTFAQKVLIPNSSTFNKLIQTLTPQNETKKITEYADSIGIHKGIVAGRIARETGTWSRMAKFRQSLNFAESK